MDQSPVCRVNLRDPEVLDRVVKEHLRFSACPVDGQPFPGLLAAVTLVLDLPDGSEQTCDAQAVLQLGPDRFIVQLMQKVDVPFLAFLGRLATRAGRAGGPPAARASGQSDSPFEGAPLAPRRERNLPKKDAGLVTHDRSAATERSTQPPPRVGAGHRLKRS